MPPKKDKKTKAKRVVKRRAHHVQPAVASAVVNIYHEVPMLPHFTDKGHYMPFSSGDKGARAAIQSSTGTQASTESEVRGTQTYGIGHVKAPRPQMISAGTQYPIIYPTRAELQAQGLARRADLTPGPRTPPLGGGVEIFAIQGQNARSRAQEARRDAERERLARAVAGAAQSAASDPRGGAASSLA